MSATELICSLIGINPDNHSPEEILILEAVLFLDVCQELKQHFRTHYREYFQLLKITAKKEEFMLEKNFVRCAINDIISTEEYTLAGIAYYTETPEEVIYEIAIGRNTNPSANLLRKVIALHQSVRRELYTEVVKKIKSKYFLQNYNPEKLLS